MRLSSFGLLFCASVLSMAPHLEAAPLRSTLVASDYYVDGAHIPGISNQTGDLGPSYAGLLPVSASVDDSRKLFFWLWPNNGTVGADDLVIWLNGGPGCSSLEGMLQENGPVTLTSPSQGVTTAKVNPYSWHKLSNYMVIDQPVSTGFSTGQPDIHDETGVASEFYAFLLNFYKTFPQFQGKKLWITGESYAGQYIPHIADYIYKQTNTLNLQGIAINDPSFVNDLFGEDIPAYQFALNHKETLQLNNSFIAELTELAKEKGVATYLQDHLKFPPTAGPILPPNQLQEGDIWNPVYEAASNANPCFSVYYIDNKCPTPLDPLGFPLDGGTDASKKNFINDTPGLKKYLHADTSKTWYECTHGNVFTGSQGDTSLAPTDTGLFGSVIDKSVRTVVQHGLRDYVLIANGSLLGIQNTTWGGLQGFQQDPQDQSRQGNLKINGKATGSYHIERKLLWATVDLAGHMIPQFQPETAYMLQQYLLGQTEL